MNQVNRMNRVSRVNGARQVPAQVELRIAQLIIDDLGTGSPDALVAAMTTELEAVLARELAGRGLAGELARSPGLPADRVRATVSLPPAGGTGGATGAGRAIGATLARVVAGRQDSPRQPGGAP